MNEDRYIYLVFSFTGTLLSKTIKYVTKDEYAHVSICFEDTFKEMYSFGRKYPSNPIIAGLVKEDLFNGVFVANKDSKCLIYKVPVTEEQYTDLRTGLDKFMSEQSKYRYNFAGLLALRCNLPLKRKYHYFCSQFVSELLINSNIAEIKKAPELIKPCELININNKLLVFEGTIADFAEKMNFTSLCN